MTELNSTSSQADSNSVPVMATPKPLDQLPPSPKPAVSPVNSGFQISGAPISTPAANQASAPAIAPVPTPEPKIEVKPAPIESPKPVPPITSTLASKAVPPPLPQSADPLSNPLNRRSSDGNDPNKQSNSEFLSALGANPAGINGSIEKPVKEEVDIYVMPKEFQKHNKVAGSGSGGGLMVMIVGVLLLFLAGGAIYIFIFQPDLVNNLFVGFNTKKEEPVNSQPVVNNLPVQTVSTTLAATTTPVVATSTVPELNPMESYTQFNKALQSALTFDDYQKAVTAFGSLSLIAQTEVDRTTKASVSEESAKQFLSSLKTSTPNLTGAEKNSIENNAGGDQATLSIVLKDGVAPGVVKLLLEDNKWKIDSQDWPSLRVQEISYTHSEDRDNDLLTDKEEILLGSDPLLKDTDGDGYEDGSEVANLYDPAAAKKLLIDSSSVRLDTQEKLFFSALVPSAWSPNKVDNSITYVSNDNQQFKITTLVNANGESAASYYISITGDKTVDNNRAIKGSNWTAVFNKYFTTAYITDNSKKHIYVVEYQTGSSNLLAYDHLFMVMIKSFVVK